MKSVIVALVMLIGSQVMAQAQVLSGGFHLSEGQTKSISINAAYVEQVFVQAEGASRQDAMFEVWANGRPKGSIYVPGRDPSYIVTIRETVRSLEFRHVSGGSVRVYQVRGSLSGGITNIGQRPPLAGLGYSGSTAVELAQRAVAVVNDLKPMANMSQLETYLMPIRKSAARLYAIGASNAPYSLKVRNALIDLESKLTNAAAYIEQNLETDAAFDVTVEMMTIKETINSML
jgi:hypothetical protein